LEEGKSEAQMDRPAVSSTEQKDKPTQRNFKSPLLTTVD
jgi:hypothetical protein